MCVYIYIYIYASLSLSLYTVGRAAAERAAVRSVFIMSKFKLSVSNPESEYVAHLSALSQISNCQGLGRKSKHEILKTDRTYGEGTAAGRGFK